MAVHGFFEHFIAGLSALLGLIHYGIRISKNGFGLAIMSVEGDSNAGGGKRFCTLQQYRLTDLSEQSLRCGQG